MIQQSIVEAIEPRSRSRFASQILRGAAIFWFGIAVIGQLVFASYVLLFYGRAAASGNLAAWNRVMPHGYVAGDTVGNFAVGMHLTLAVVIILSGALQIVPQVRSLAPAFHRWNGRLYLLSVIAISMGGLYMVWVRGSVGDLPQHLGITGNAILILLFAGLALRTAMLRRFSVHRRWALRLYVAAGGVWFFRVSLMLWLFLNNGPVGFDPKRFVGPFLSFLSFAQYLIPLAVLEVYLYAKDRGGDTTRILTAALLGMLTLAMGVGITIATLGMWMPRMR